MSASIEFVGQVETLIPSMRKIFMAAVVAGSGPAVYLQDMGELGHKNVTITKYVRKYN